MVANFVLRRRASGAIKRILGPQIPNDIFNTVIPILMICITLLSFKLYYFVPIASAFSNVKSEFRQLEVTFHNDVGFATVYRRIYCRKFSASSNQISLYTTCISKCIRILNQRWFNVVCLLGNVLEESVNGKHRRRLKTVIDVDVRGDLARKKYVKFTYYF